MQRGILAVLILSLVGATVVAIAQSPSPNTPPPAVVVPPATPGAPAATPPSLGEFRATSTAAAPPQSPITQFEPLAAFPQSTQNAVRGVVMGANWLTRMNQAQGRFLVGYNPALREPMLGDNDLKQARAALGLAQAAKFTGDEKQATIASQAILTLLAATKIDPADANCRVPVHSSFNCNRVGFAAIVAMAIYELPAADAKLVAEAERLCVFLYKQCRTDGSVQYTDGPTDIPSQIDPQGMNEYPGTALHAIMLSNRNKPANWKTEVAKKGMEHYRAKFKAAPNPLLAATLTPACAELYLQCKDTQAALAVYEMNDWLCALQISGNDLRVPQWAGGFRAIVNGQATDSPVAAESGLYVQSLAMACRLTRLTPDVDRNTRYKIAVTEGSQFLCGLQYLEANTRHFENTFRANMIIGAFHLSPTDGNMRIDATGNSLAGLLGYLSSGAEK